MSYCEACGESVDQLVEQADDALARAEAAEARVAELEARVRELTEWRPMRDFPAGDAPSIVLEWGCIVSSARRGVDGRVVEVGSGRPIAGQGWLPLPPPPPGGWV